MAEIPRTPSREEREFWDRRFDDDDRAAARDPYEPHDPRDPRDPRSGAPRAGSRAPAHATFADGAITRLVDRVRDWRNDARFGVVALVLVAVVAGVIWYRIGIGGASAGASSTRASAPTTTEPGVTATTTPSTSATRTSPGVSTNASANPATSKGSASLIAVHVAGAVTRPGVVELPTGSRVIDAVEAVGGAVAGADLDRLNLAAKLADGQRVYVARAGQADPGVGAEVVGGTGGDSSTSGSGAAAAGPVNLNTASQAQLEELPGIGPTYAQAIIAERQRRGGFKSVNELRSVRGIGDKRFTELAPLVAV